MKRSITGELFDYWNRLRGSRCAPDRCDIEPGAIRACLPHTFLLACDAGRGHPFRLAGTSVCDLFGRELKGAGFIDLWTADSRPQVAGLLRDLAEDCTGAIATVTGQNGEADRLQLDMILLPLTCGGDTPGRFLGGFALRSEPYWAGVREIQSLELGHVRYAGPRTCPAAACGLTAGTDAPRRRPGFVVYPAAARRFSAPRNYQG